MRRGSSYQPRLMKIEVSENSCKRELLSIGSEFEALVQVAHLFHEGQTAYANSDYDRAIGFFNDALALRPDNIRFLIRLGRCYTNKGSPSRAEHYLRTAMQLDPNDMDAVRALAASRRYQDLPEAISYAEQAANAQPANAENSNYLGLLLRDEQPLSREAVRAHREALNVATLDDPINLFYLAALSYRLAKHDDAKHLHTLMLPLTWLCSNGRDELSHSGPTSCGGRTRISRTQVTLQRSR